MSTNSKKYSQAYYQKNKERMDANQNKLYAKNKKEMKEKRRQYYLAHKEIYSENAKQYRARIKNEMFDSYIKHVKNEGNKDE